MGAALAAAQRQERQQNQQKEAEAAKEVEAEQSEAEGASKGKGRRGMGKGSSTRAVPPEEADEANDEDNEEVIYIDGGENRESRNDVAGEDGEEVKVTHL